MHINCPHCKNLIDVVGGDSDQVTCPLWGRPIGTESRIDHFASKETGRTRTAHAAQRSK